MKKLSVMLIVCLVVFAGCKKEKSQNTNPDHIQQEIWSIYDADNNDSYFGIRFYDLEWYKRVILGPPCYITMNTYDMKLNEVNLYYELNFDNEKVQTGTFIYSDVLQRVFTNAVDVEKAIELPSIDTIFKSKDNVITWNGDPCSGPPEVITVHVGFILPLYSVTTSQAGATSITIKSEASSGIDLGSGWSRIRIDRETTSPLQQGTQAGGKIVKRYKSKVKWVWVQ